jgi:hypothetical protein
MKKYLFIIIPLFVLFVLPVFGQNDPAKVENSFADTLQESIKLFDSDELLEISMRFDIKYYMTKKPDDEYLDAILTYYLSDNDSISEKLKVKSRGEFRRTFCNFPPLLLNFRMTDSTKGEFYGIDKLKMVPHCKSGFEEYILKEYLIYKLYNVLTDNSFRVRLLRVDYINTGKKIKPIKEFGFVIEPLKLLEKRTNSVKVDLNNLTQKNIIPEVMDRMAIFNYMIGNTDWSVPNQHNVKILLQSNAERPDLGITVPYDFDYTGLVNADYAIPIEELGIESVRERLYVGICRSEETFNNALKEFSDKKEEFFRVINEFPYLKERSKKEMIHYLNGFFKEFDKRNTIVYLLLKDCKNF